VAKSVFEAFKLVFNLDKSKLPVFALKAFPRCFSSSFALFTATYISFVNVKPSIGLIVDKPFRAFCKSWILR